MTSESGSTPERPGPPSAAPTPVHPGAAPPAAPTAATAVIGGPPPPQRSERPPLRRPAGDRVLAGVSEGIGRYLRVDPVLIRVAFVALVFLAGLGLVLYLVGVLAMPIEGSRDSLMAAALRHRRRFRSIFAMTVITLGVILLAGGAVPLTVLFVWWGIVLLRRLPDVEPPAPGGSLAPVVPGPVTAPA